MRVWGRLFVFAVLPAPAVGVHLAARARILPIVDHTIDLVQR
jgi:hypothetical protein